MLASTFDAMMLGVSRVDQGMAAYLPAELLVKSGRTPLLKVRRSIRSELSNVILLLLSVGAVLLLNHYFLDWKPPPWPIIEHLSIRWLFAVPVLLLLEMIRKYHDDLYLFGVHRVRQLDGRLSFTYQRPNVRYSDIKAIRICQDIPGRIFNYGSIELSTAGTDAGEMCLEGVVAPFDLVEVIEGLRRHSLKLVAERSRIAEPVRREPVRGAPAQIAVGAEDEMLPISPS